MYMGQLDLFATGNCDFEEEQKEVEEKRKVALEIERRKKEREEFLTKNLTSRQHRLVDYLKDNFVSGKWFTIEELCSANLGYILNTNPRVHDKCASLGADIRAINWAIASRYSIIINCNKFFYTIYFKVKMNSIRGRMKKRQRWRENTNTLIIFNIKQIVMALCHLSTLMIEH